MIRLYSEEEEKIKTSSRGIRLFEGDSPSAPQQRQAFQPEPFTEREQSALGTFRGTTEALAGIQEDPLNLQKEKSLTERFTSPFKAGAEAFKGAVVEGSESIAQLISVNRFAPDSLPFIGQVKSRNRSDSQVIGETLEGVSGLATAGFGGISALFMAAEETPIAGTLAKLISLPFVASSEVAIAGVDKGLDAIPDSVVSKQAKDNVREGAHEVAALMAQMAVGGVAFKLSKQGRTGTKPDFLEGLPGRQKHEVTLDIATAKPELAPALEKVKAEKVTELVERFGKEDATVLLEKTAEHVVGKKEPIRIEDATIEGSKLTPFEGTGETKARGLSETVADRATSEKVTNDFGALPEYERVNFKEQMDFITDFANKNPESAFNVALGRETAPPNLIPELIFKLVEERAVKAGDINMLHDLANSALTVEATTMGQRIRALGERNPESPVERIRQIAGAREEAYVRKNKQSSSKAKKSTAKDIKESIKKSSPKIKNWEEFIESITC